MCLIKKILRNIYEKESILINAAENLLKISFELKLNLQKNTEVILLFY